LRDDAFFAPLLANVDDQRQTPSTH